VLLGGLAALAMLVESGVQQWSGIFLRDTAGAPAGLAVLAPGVFAAGMVAGRLGGHTAAQMFADRRIAATAGLAAAATVLLLAAAPHYVVALSAIALTGVAVSPITPTVYGRAGRTAEPGRRGAVVGATASIAYTGLLGGPALVGVLAGMAGLRAAVGLLSVAAVTVGGASLFVL
jgi:fucose permease